MFKFSQIGPKRTTNFQGLASFWNKDCFLIFFFLKRCSIKFCIWKSNRFFSIGWVSPPKNGPKVKKRGYASKKNDTKTARKQDLVELQQKVFL